MALKQKVLNFQDSRYYPLTLVVLAMLGSLLSLEGAVSFVMVCCISMTLIFSSDLSSTFLPFLLICQLAGSGVGDYYSFGAWIIASLPFLFFAVIYNIVKFKKRFTRGSSLLPLICVACAVTLGGVGSLTPQEYFTLGGILHIILLGVGMLTLYILLRTLWQGNAGDKLADAFSASMMQTSIFCVFYIVTKQFIPSIPYRLSGELWMPETGVNEFANHISFFIILCLPFIFKFAVKNNAYTLLAWAAYAAIVLAGGRTGILFGAVIMVTCYLWLIIKKAERRIFNTVTLCCFILAGFIAIQYASLTVYTTGSSFLFFATSDVRFKLIRRSIIDFLSSPIFGRGISYLGNIDLYVSETVAMHWYHNFISQIFGSLGLVGAAAYSYLFITRVKLLKSEKSLFATSCAICYFALLLSSLTEPGIFSPIPSAVVIMFAFIMLEMKEKKDV